MGLTTFSPPRVADDPDVEALASTFSHADGVKVLHETIQYLRERAEHEGDWLEALASLELPTTLIWGLEDTVSPPRVAMYVWGQFLMHKPGRNSFYLVPDANHYLQVDRPGAVVAAVLHAVDPAAEAAPGPISPEPRSAVLVDRSRPGLPDAAEALAAPINEA
jgi:pimeloyl-ACP methyl ester carboxylesterase